MTALITGATGFIGSYVVKQLLEEGESFVAFDRNPVGSLPDVLGAEAAGVEVVVGDVVDFPYLVKLVRERGITRILNLAGELHAMSVDNPGKCISSNIVGTHNILELGRLLGLERVVTTSSAALFGSASRHPGGKVPSDPSLVARDVYEATKIFNESEVDFYAERFGVDCAALRIGLAYGYGCKLGTARKLIDEVIVKPLHGQPGRPDWGGDFMNWVYAPDAADAFVRLLRGRASGVRNYNIRGDYRGIDELAAIARDLIPGADIQAVPGSHGWAQDVDDSLLRRDTGYRCRHTLEQGLAGILAQVRAAEPATAAGAA